MTAKKKAIELVDKMEVNHSDVSTFIAKKWALITADEIIATLTDLWGGAKETLYWQQVKAEIEKL